MLTDRLTYPGFKSAAAAAGVRLVGVEADRGGMIPAALEEACQAAQAQGRLSRPDHPQSDDARRCLPTRREQLAAAIRKRGLLLFEDDAYGAFDPKLAPIATLDSRAQLSRRDPVEVHRARPARVASGDARPRRRRRCSAMPCARWSQMPVPLMVALVLRWLADGSADAIIAAIAAEAAARQKLAAKALAGQDYAAHPKRPSCLAAPAGRPGPAWSSPLMCNDRGLPS